MHPARVGLYSGTVGPRSCRILTKRSHGLMRAALPLALLFGSASGRVGARPTGSDSHRVLQHADDTRNVSVDFGKSRRTSPGAKVHEGSPTDASGSFARLRQYGRLTLQCTSYILHWTYIKLAGSGKFGVKFGSLDQCSKLGSRPLFYEPRKFRER